MKKLNAMLVAGVLTLGMTMTAFANPSISTVATDKVVVSADSAAAIPEGKEVTVAKADPETYANADVADVVKKVNDPEETLAMKDILELLKVEIDPEDPEKVIKTTSDKEIDPLEYEIITEFADLILTDGTNVEYDVDGEVLSVEVTLTAEALKDTKAEDLLVMQLDPREVPEVAEGEEEPETVYFIEIEEEDLDPETGEVTITFPCLGPFTFLEK